MRFGNADVGSRKGRCSPIDRSIEWQVSESGETRRTLRFDDESTNSRRKRSLSQGGKARSQV